MNRLGSLHGAMIFVLAMALFIVGAYWFGTHTVSVPLVLFAVLVVTAQTIAGLLVLHIGNLGLIKARLPSAFCIGFACLSLPMYALCAMLSIPALWAFELLVGLLLAVFAWPRARAVIRQSIVSTDTSFDALAALVIVLGVGLLIRVPVAAAYAFKVSGALPIWSDYFIHGATISSFGGLFANGVDLELPGVGRVFYHYAPFMLPAAFQSITGGSGLVLATSILLPLGILIAALGCYVFATQLGGRALGLLSVAIVAAIPVYRIPLQSGWFDFDWLLLIAPGSGYAIGLAMVMCAGATLDTKSGTCRRVTVLGLLLVSLILIRAHFFLLLLSALSMYFLVCQPWIKRRWLIVALGVIGLIGVLALIYVSELRTWVMTLSKPYEYLNFALQSTSANGHQLALSSDPTLRVLLLRTTVVLVSVLGAYAILYPVLTVATALRGELRREDWLGLFVLLSFLGLMLLAPAAANGDLTEYKHRHFLFLYVFVGTCSVAYVYRLLSSSCKLSRFLDCSCVFLALLVFCAAIFLSRGHNPAKPDLLNMPGAGQMHNQVIKPGLVDVAHFMQSRAHYGDVMAMSGQAISSPSWDIVQLISLTGVPAFLSRTELRLLRGECVKRVVGERVDVLNRVASAANWDAAKLLLRANGIRWFFVSISDPVAWSADLSAPVFSAGSMSVYDAGVVPEASRFEAVQCG
ncbi:hypothetical protein [Variovorax sp. HJSM1_2]|uniref:hypothetical protein n=1 Tax=Variovorax sp. HJSM1_2 TaxID=3366263 RepID=UPI003BC5E92B